MRISDSTEVDVRVINKDTKENIPFVSKGDSKNHFFETTYTHNNETYHIQLRLDWTDMVKGSPRMDIDIWTEKEWVRKNKKIPFEEGSGGWHHNDATLDAEGHRTYTADIRALGYRLPLIVSMDYRINV